MGPLNLSLQADCLCTPEHVPARFMQTARRHSAIRCRLGCLATAARRRCAVDEARRARQGRCKPRGQRRLIAPQAACHKGRGPRECSCTPTQGHHACRPGTGGGGAPRVAVLRAGSGGQGHLHGRRAHLPVHAARAGLPGRPVHALRCACLLRVQGLGLQRLPACLRHAAGLRARTHSLVQALKLGLCQMPGDTRARDAATSCGLAAPLVSCCLAGAGHCAARLELHPLSGAARHMLCSVQLSGCRAVEVLGASCHRGQPVLARRWPSNCLGAARPCLIGGCSSSQSGPDGQCPSSCSSLAPSL